MSHGVVLVDRRDAIGVITLNRPDVLNAMNHHLMRALGQAVQELEQDPDARVVVITGAGGAFSAGADIHEQVERERKPPPKEAEPAPVDRVNPFWRVAACPKPVIAAIGGVAIGGGALLATAADWRFGCERSRFRFPGVPYGRLNSTWSLGAIVGVPRAKDLIMSARMVEAEEAFRIGLLDRLWPSDRLMEETLAYARALAANPPEWVQLAKRVLNEQVGMGIEEAYRAEEAARSGLRTPPAREAFKEFMGRQPLREERGSRNKEQGPTPGAA